MIKKFLIFLIQFYQKYISPALGHHCRFHPSCSQYAKEALEVYPIWKAIPKTLYRLIRCQPFCQGGHDPVVKEKSSPLN